MAGYILPPLPYAYNALEPIIDAKTVEIHYTKHHKAYLDKLNELVKRYPSFFEGKSIEEVLSQPEEIPADIRQDVINQGGGMITITYTFIVYLRMGRENLMES